MDGFAGFAGFAGSPVLDWLFGTFRCILGQPMIELWITTYFDVS